ncbi:MAG TPA: hypothetical protein VNX68_12860 [Nitrosopumilaceae archaeon]|nr:hypothetical protein [Nitrosopumilaceae archaeon]
MDKKLEQIVKSLEKINLTLEKILFELKPKNDYSLKTTITAEPIQEIQTEFDIQPDKEGLYDIHRIILKG